MSDDSGPGFRLPASVVEVVDINRLIRELNSIDDYLAQEKATEPEKDVPVKTSDKLADVLKLNSINLQDADQRTALAGILGRVKSSAPTVSVSFAARVGQEFMAKIVGWFRSQVHPYCLLVVGLDPNIGIGTIVKTNTKVFDFSLNNQLKSTADQLADGIKQIGNVKVEEASQS